MTDNILVAILIAFAALSIFSAGFIYGEEHAKEHTCTAQTATE